MAVGDAAVVVSRSRFISIRGFTLSGAKIAGVLLRGGVEAGNDLMLDGNDIHNNGEAGGNGVTIGAGNRRVWIVNNVIRHNVRNGVAIEGEGGGRAYLVNNTFVGNGWNGVAVGRGEEAILVNNLIVGNRTASGTTGGRWGLARGPPSSMTAPSGCRERISTGDRAYGVEAWTSATPSWRCPLATCRLPRADRSRPVAAGEPGLRRRRRYDSLGRRSAASSAFRKSG